MPTARVQFVELVSKGPWNLDVPADERTLWVFRQ